MKKRSARKKIEVEEGYTLDSNEELYFLWWLREMKEAGCILRYDRAETIKLSEKITHPRPGKNGTLQSPIYAKHYYTPDFTIKWSSSMNGKAFMVLGQNYGRQPKGELFAHVETDFTSIVEVKGSNLGMNSGMSNIIRIAQNDIKWTYQKTGLLVNLIQISNQADSFFDRTFTPERYLTTDKTGRPRSLKYKPRTLEEFINR